MGHWGKADRSGSFFRQTRPLRDCDVGGCHAPSDFLRSVMLADDWTEYPQPIIVAGSFLDEPGGALVGESHHHPHHHRRHSHAQPWWFPEAEQATSPPLPFLCMRWHPRGTDGHGRDEGRDDLSVRSGTADHPGPAHETIPVRGSVGLFTRPTSTVQRGWGRPDKTKEERGEREAHSSKHHV